MTVTATTHEVAYQRYLEFKTAHQRGTATIEDRVEAYDAWRELLAGEAKRSRLLGDSDRMLDEIADGFLTGHYQPRFTGLADATTESDRRYQAHIEAYYLINPNAQNVPRSSQLAAYRYAGVDLSEERTPPS